jgi:NAD(P)H-hydrate epimerase
MQKIFTVDKIRQADQYTIENEPIASIDLMERAANACAFWLIERSSEKQPFNIFCGPGNNGGDGLAVARLLSEKGFSVRVFVLDSERYSEDFQKNYKRISQSEKLLLRTLKTKADFPQLGFDDIIIDALFGSGLSKPLKALAAQLIQFLNEQKALRIAIDISSGLYADKAMDDKKKLAFQADYTLSFQFPKLAFFMPENDRFSGDWQLLDIGLAQDYIQNTPTPFYLFDSLSAKELIRPRPKFAHKGIYGHALLIAGSEGKMGAALLAGKAALRSGAGLVSVHHPKSGVSILPTAVPELMSSLDPNERVFSKCPTLDNYSAIAIGPGLGKDKLTQTAFKILIQETKTPLIIDADALNILSENKTWLNFLPKNSILTPHVKEFERLAGTAKNDFDRLDKQIAFAQKYQVYLILKGAHTRIACPDGKVFINPSGNPGMATAGSGDVLTGILLGLLAQSYSSLNTCLLGVFLHGLAGDFAAENKGQYSLIAGDIVESLSEAFLI